MYRPGAGTVRQTRYQGMGERAPDQDTEAWKADLDKLIQDLIQDEIEASRKYQNFINGIEKYGVAPINSDEGRKYKQMKELVTHIRTQEEQHRSLLERLKTHTLYFGGFLNKPR